MKQVFVWFLAGIPSVSLAATLFVQWTDPVAPGPAYAPAYAAEYRVNGGAATAITGLPAPTLTQAISAVAGNTVEVRYRADNTVVPSYPINGPWSVWYPATQAASPQTQPAPTVTVFTY